MIDFQFNYPILGTEAAILSAALQKQIAVSTAWLAGKPAAGTPEQREVAAAFLSRENFKVPSTGVFLCSGGHCAISVALTSARLAGAAIAVDEFSYPGFRMLAANRGVQVFPCAGDEEGMLPDALAEAATKLGAKAVYLMPTIHNPLGIVVPPGRRQALADVILRHGLYLIEDDAYRFLDPHPPAPISFAIPDSSFYILSFSKPITPALKAAYLMAPERLACGVEDVIEQSSSGTSILFAVALTSMILDGSAARLIAEKQALGRERQSLIGATLAGLKIRAHRNSFHSWIELPPGVHADDFAAACKSQGVVLSSGARYANGNPAAQRFVRLAVGNEPNRDRVLQGLAAVKQVVSTLQKNQ
ncbi:MAG: PLP-dependent aminotransferase family protein [Candidatus Acidiferrales bacterium]